MAKAKTKTKARPKVVRPSAAAQAAAREMLAVPDFLAAASRQLELLAQQMDRMEHQMRVLTTLVAVPNPKPPNLLTEPFPSETDSKLLQEFAHEGKDFP